MSDQVPPSFDLDLGAKDLQAVADVESLAQLLSRLGYDTTGRTPQVAEHLGITAEGLQRAIKRVELLATQAGFFQVYLFEVASVTLATTRGIAKAFRDKVGNFLLVLTTRDYERLDFVLVDRTPAEARPELPGKPAPPELKLRSLTVERRNPTRVQLRVLRRFTWTEADQFYQFDKIRAAYDIADWSEEHFNNRALFSDHYLLTRLRERPEWLEDPKTSFQALQALLRQAAQRFAGKAEQAARDGLLEPALRALGFELRPGERATSDASEPDYRLFVPGAKTDAKPAALCLAYAWDRSLDGKDEQRDPENPGENPAFRVVSLLEHGEAPWVIVTNGRTWRLYARFSHSRATNYYEINLEEALALAGPFTPEISDAFRYFWLLFRRQAFEPRDAVRDGKPISASLADLLLLESEDYAKQLGDSLKDRVFLEVFPHLAEGFIVEFAEDRRQRLTLQQKALDAVFQGTLTLLYRLLFLQYAEARDLLPAKEARGYWEISLDRLKHEIAEIAGKLPDDAERRIERHFQANSYELQTKLHELFCAVDAGRQDLNLPFYNGGLFLSQPGDDDLSAEAAAARFLRDHRISDRHLAFAINHLTRDLDTKTGDLAFIDFKSLGVRQLGSIYEGLLEFKVRVADRPLAVVSEKGREVYVPLSDLDERKRERARREHRAVAKGDVYLENDKRERKATGSFYTPDHIVKYIVEHAVGPVLAEKLDALRPKLREAQHWHRQQVANAKTKDESPSKYESGQAVDVRWGALVDQLFDLKVLDPAMGSGHFLVEAVDFISDRMIAFLNGFPWNPVTARLAAMRAAILDQLRDQGVNVRADRLTDVNLLKRHVLKRCIFGVDINPMAVELAKVSLWLDCFTLGAPLSFLDHHLRCGNSLMGVTVDEVKAAVEPGFRIEDRAKRKYGGSGSRTVTLGSLFEGHFTRLLLATDLMRQVGELSDITVTQVRDSRDQYRRASDELAPFKRALDVYVSQWFAECAPIGHRSQAAAEPAAVAFLKAPDAEPFLSARTEQEATRAMAKLPLALRAIAETAVEAATERRFFHWELEFPEAYYEQGRPKPQPGFDAVAGNPPYDVLASEELGYDISDDLHFYESYPLFEPAIRGKKNLYKLFVCRALQLTAPLGRCSFIVPMPLLGDEQSAGVRRMLLERYGLAAVEVFPQKDDPTQRVFPEAKLSTCVFVAAGQPSGQQFVLRTHPGRTIETDSPTLTIGPTDVVRFDPTNGAIPSCSQADWDIAIRVLRLPDIARLQQIATQFQGEVNETNERPRKAFTEDPNAPLVLRGANICLYAVREASQGEDLRLNVKRFLAGKGKGTKAYAFQSARVGFQRSSPQNNFRRIVAARLEPGSFCFDTVSYVPVGSSVVDPDLLLAFLNSAFLDWYFRLGSTNSKVNEYQFNVLPIPVIETEANVRDWQPLIAGRSWNRLRAELCTRCARSGVMPADVAGAAAAMSRRIQEIEAERVLASRSDRSHLAAEAQPIQDTIDAVLFRCYGLSDDEGDYIKRRLKEML